ncbi:DUF4917 family protein [Deinococcus ruber]|uniref:DUF4917 family protein n=1 Tax=Deinococcus ruber TaxID=1848197 RepID=UPI0016694CA8|nr:DUF4917 family protein [Deinococcus ruber]
MLKKLEDILEEFSSEDAIVFGNGMSMAVLGNRFSYSNIAARIKESYLESGKRYLSSITDLRGSSINIEENIRYLDESSKILMNIINENIISPDTSIDKAIRHRDNTQLLFASSTLRDIYLDSQREMIEAIIALHPEAVDKNPKLLRMHNLLNLFRHIFTVNFDVLTYIAFSSFVTNGVTKFSDMFVKHDQGSSVAHFKPPESVNDGRTYLYYLHGGIHIFTDSEKRTTYKVIRAPHETIIMAVRRKINESGSIPIFVFEGTKEYKMERISSNAYLKKCYESLSEIESSRILIFGLELMDNDRHIIEAISRNKNIQKIYFGIYSHDELDIDYIRARTRLLLKNSGKEIIFYSTSEYFGHL